MSVCSLTIVAFWKCLCLKILQFQTLNFVADIVQWWAGANSALLSLFGSCIPQQFFLFYLIIFGLGLWLQLLYFSGLQGCFLCSYNLKCPTFFFYFSQCCFSLWGLELNLLSHSVKLKSPDYTANLSEPVQLKQINMCLLSHGNQKEKLPRISSAMWLCKQTNASL